MIGRLIESRRPFPWGVLVFVLLGVALVVLAVLVRTYEVAVGACLPFLIALALGVRRERVLGFELTETAIEVHDPPQTIPYESLESLIALARPGDPDKKGPRHYPIDVVHENGTLHIPARLDVSSDKVFSFLLSTFSESGSSHVSAALRGYRDEQTATFGPERVWSYRARSNLGTRAPGRGMAMSLGILLAGIVWVVAGIVIKQEGWIIAGIGVGLLGGLLILVDRSQPSRPHSRRIKGWQKACLVISPVGIALSQGDLKGEMRWDELRDMKLKTPPHTFQYGHHPFGWGILLSFEGAQISIADIYDRPLPIIYRQMRDYWREP
ncbi:MAG: hypothetical protein HYS12_09285 [Planctomycetes bacterium]|nr:hypothetical protein [Planctomycetota bacterium]